MILLLQEEGEGAAPNSCQRFPDVLEVLGKDILSGLAASQGSASSSSARLYVT